jgi:hypothetical protein
MDAPCAFEVEAEFEAARMKTGGPIQLLFCCEFVPLEAEAKFAIAAKEWAPSAAHVTPRRSLGECFAARR